MLERYVFQSRKRQGRVIGLLCRGAAWSPRSVDEVIADIGSGRARYLVNWESGPVVVGVSEAYGLDAPGPDSQPGGLLLLPDG